MARSLGLVVLYIICAATCWLHFISAYCIRCYCCSSYSRSKTTSYFPYPSVYRYPTQHHHQHGFADYAHYLRSSRYEAVDSSSRWDVQSLLLKQLELVVRASNAAYAELYVNEKYSDLWRLDGGSKTEVIYESVDGGWFERLHDGSHVVYRCHGAAAKDHYDASDNYDNNVTTLSFPLMSIHGKKDAVYYGRLLVYVQKSEHGASRDNDFSRASLSMLLQSFSESMSMIVSMSCNTAIDEMVVANRLADLRDDSLSIQYNTRSALQTISTYVRLLQRRMRGNDEIGLELLDNVLVQVHSIDVNVNAVGDSIDTGGGTAGGGVHRKALYSNAMSRQVVFAAGDDPINNDDSVEFSGHGDDDGGPLQLTENSLAQDDQCVDGSSVVTLNNSSSSSSYNAESSIIESTIVWTTTKQEIEVNLMVDGDREDDDDGSNDDDAS